MKKQRLFLGLCCLPLLALCACGRSALPDITMGDVVAANRTETLLANYGSFRSETFYEGEVAATVYADSTLCYESQADYEQITGEGFKFIHSGDQYYGCLVADGSDAFVNDGYTMSPESGTETVLEMSLENGELLLTTMLGAETAKSLYPGDGINDPEAITGVRSQYRLDGKTLAVREQSSSFLFADGTEQNASSVQVEYGAPRPPQAEALLERCRPESDLRTLTVILDPGTAQEKVFTQAVRKGDPFTVILPSGYEMYSDEDCTLLYRSDKNWDAHLLIYAKLPAATTETAADPKTGS